MTVCTSKVNGEELGLLYPTCEEGWVLEGGSLPSVNGLVREVVANEARMWPQLLSSPPILL